MTFIFLSALDGVPDGGAAGFELAVGDDAVPLLALRACDTVRVFHNVCPHAARRLEVAPGRFIVDAGTLVCAAHGACFTIPGGDCVAGPCRGQSLREVPSEVRGDQLWVDSAAL
ncbi:Rieske 2Fe-2S domain-containing protein [Xanthomonadaceae bacterium XH05]|nr:Rieske 2Fe-2S domain-containing protein [Xanthomonadaceae bacterium XH05]